MNWEMLGTLCAICGIQGGILLAAAKSIFVTKRDYEDDMKSVDGKLYDSRSMPIFVTRKEWKESRDDRERRRDASQRALCGKIEKMNISMDEVKSTQNETNLRISNLLGRFESYIKIKEGK